MRRLHVYWKRRQLRIGMKRNRCRGGGGGGGKEVAITGWLKHRCSDEAHVEQQLVWMYGGREDEIVLYLCDLRVNVKIRE